MSSVSCNRSYLPLCSIPARMSRDGYAGPNAKITLPFYGFYFFNGGSYTFPGGVAAQDPRMFNGGGTQPDTFRKDCCS